jgi:tetratricopeptide (TPR) repeat protein
MEHPTQVSPVRLAFACALLLGAALPTAWGDYWEHPDHTPVPTWSSPQSSYQPQQLTPEQQQQIQQEAARRERLKTAHDQNEQGISADENNNWEDAINDFQNATINDPDNPVYRRNLAIAKNNAGITFWDNGDMDTAVAYLEDALRDNPEDPTIRSNLARGQQIQKDQQEDAERKHQAQVAAELAKAQNHEGFIAYNNHDWATAIKDFQDALQNRPTSKLYRQNLANAQGELRKQEAEEERKRSDVAASGNIHQDVHDFAERLRDSSDPSNGSFDFDKQFRASPSVSGGSDSLGPSVVDGYMVPSGLPKAVDAAIAGAFSDASADVRNRVRKGMQAVVTNDWKVAKAWFGDALNHDPNNALLKEWVAACDGSTGDTTQEKQASPLTDDEEIRKLIYEEAVKLNRE